MRGAIYLSLILISVSLSVGEKAETEAAGTPRVDDSLQLYASHKASARLPDGRGLHFVCAGKGSPTVILTAGAGADATDWRFVLARMSQLTRVCAWDRPGFGFSDGSALEQTVLTTTADLESGLAAGSIVPPYVMVGHSLGAYETLLFADRNPDEMAGMVLVDPSIPNQLAIFESLFRPELISSRLAGQQRRIDFLRACAASLRNGSIERSGANLAGCFAYPPSYPPELVADLRAKAMDPLRYEAAASYLANAAGGGALVADPGRYYGSMPLIVLTAGNPIVWAGMTPEEEAAMARAWSRAHDALAALSINGVNTRVPGAGHSIHLDKPQAVIDGIETVVRQARAVP